MNRLFLKSVLLVLILSFSLTKDLPTVTLYTESYCGGCVDYETTVLKDFINNPSKNQLANLEVIVYGNTKEDEQSKEGERKYICQHGEKECYGNKVENCAQNILSKEKAEAFLLCAGGILEETAFESDFNTILEKCIENNEEKTQIIECSNSTKGDELVHQAEVNTGKHSYVPYLLLNGKHSFLSQYQMRKNLVKYLCKYNDLIGKVEGCPDSLNYDYEELEGMSTREIQAEGLKGSQMNEYVTWDDFKVAPKVVVYTESYCPACVRFESIEYNNFISNQSRKLLGEVDIVTFGNARELPDSKKESRKFSCQHGDKECYGNKVDNCVEKKVEKKVSEEFLVCAAKMLVASLMKVDYDSIMNNCLKNESDLTAVKACVDSAEGDEYVHQAAVKTKNHEYVPYIIVNGEHSDEIQAKVQNDMVGFLCEYNDLVGKVSGCPSKIKENEKKRAEVTLNNNKPKITVYTESLCPDCLGFENYALKALVNNPSRDLLADFENIAFGNAKELKDSKEGNRKFQCQHGEPECYGNKVDNCAEKYFPEKIDYERFLVCASDLFFSSKSSSIPNTDYNEVMEKCILNEKIHNEIKTCANNKEGDELLHIAAEKTGDHEYVPHVIFNGVHDKGIENKILNDIVGFLCEYNNLIGKVEGCEKKEKKVHRYVKRSVCYNNEVEKPKITVYTESLCPFCMGFENYEYRNFIQNVSKDQLADIEFVVFGNAYEEESSVKGNRKFVCQHGEAECLGNKAENCVQEHFNSENTENFILCASQQYFDSKEKDFNNIIEKCILNQEDKELIKTCTNGEEGDELLHKAAQNTGDHKYVPYFIFNGVHDEDIQNKLQSDIVGFLCEYNQIQGKVEGCPSKEEEGIENNEEDDVIIERSYNNVKAMKKEFKKGLKFLE